MSRGDVEQKCDPPDADSIAGLRAIMKLRWLSPSPLSGLLN
jgi:hypothetical protein